MTILVRRGVSTQGVVVSVEHFVIAGQAKALVITGFKTLTDPPESYQTTGNGQLIYPKAGAKVNVIYDPKNPAGNAYAGQRWALMMFPMIFSILGLMLVAIAVFLMYVFWLL